MLMGYVRIGSMWIHQTCWEFNPSICRFHHQTNGLELTNSRKKYFFFNQNGVRTQKWHEIAILVGT